ncbi:unnamed protein product [Blepharisma stoltei]|uniref:Ankyrin repeat domain-containing protein n=1 Tax=Blepharisma stoltei TaxID=1481888 RepID=A0AAU9IMT9_9CILI|nr:unnamed protein product [Blepharisma stoltei]
MELRQRVFTAEVPEEEHIGLLRFESLNQEMQYMEELKNDTEIMEKTMKLNEEIFEAVEDRDKEKLDNLLKNRGNIILLCWYIARAFNLALSNNDVDILQCFIKNGLDLSHAIFKGTLPKFALSWIDDENYYKVLDLLLEGGLHIDDMESEGYNTALHFACLRLERSLVELLIRKHANVNPINKLKLMPLNLVENISDSEALRIAEILRNAGGKNKWNDYWLE